MFEYLDDEGRTQGPYPQSTLSAWVQGGFFDGTRMVRPAEGEAAFCPVASVPELAQFLPAISLPTTVRS